MEMKVGFLRTSEEFTTALTGREGIVLLRERDDDGGVPVWLDGALKSLHPDVVVVLK